LEFDWIFDAVASAINDVVERFISEPFFFYTEQDMHAYVYHKLITGRLGKEHIVTYFGDKTILVHREYPTLNTYPSKHGTSTRGHFDLAVIDPTHASSSHWRKRVTQPPYAVPDQRIEVVGDWVETILQALLDRSIEGVGGPWIEIDSVSKELFKGFNDSSCHGGILIKLIS
jgi:hypothetical protein